MCISFFKLIADMRNWSLTMSGAELQHWSWGEQSWLASVEHSTTATVGLPQCNNATQLYFSIAVLYYNWVARLFSYLTAMLCHNELCCTTAVLYHKLSALNKVSPFTTPWIGDPMSVLNWGMTTFGWQLLYHYVIPFFVFFYSLSFNAYFVWYKQCYPRFLFIVFA